MADKQAPSIQIQQMNMRLPGRSPEAAHRIADNLGQDLARALAPSESRRYGSLSVRVPVASNASDAEISMAVANAIARALQKERRR
jgi:5-carboxymethyl-2-hydroxymuconate isomerase